MKEIKLTKQYLYIDFLVQPAPVMSVVITFLNDHWLKYNYPGFITGKLSDFCGLFYFPLFICALGLLMRQYLFFRPPLTYLAKPWLVICLSLTALMFILIKLHPPATNFYLWSLSQWGIHAEVTRDATDLSALSVLIFTYLQGQRYFSPSITEL